MRPDSNTRRATVPKLRLFVDGYTQIYIIIEINKEKKFQCRIRDAAAILVFVSSTYFMKEARDGREGGGGGLYQQEIPAHFITSLSSTCIKVMQWLVFNSHM